MKILHVINGLGVGGAEKLIDDLLPMMNHREGIDAHVLLLDDSDRFFGKSLEESKVKVCQARNRLSLRNVDCIRKAIIKGEYDIVHSHLFPSNYFTAIAARLAKTDSKLITTEHNTHNRRRDRPYLKPLERIMYSSYNRVVSISVDTHVKLIEWLRPSSEQMRRFEVINNGVDLTRFSSAVAYRKCDLHRSIHNEAVLLCMVGSFTSQKDQGTIIRALEELPHDVLLVLVGDGPLRHEAEQLADMLGVSDRVIFLGVRDDVHRILRTVDIVVLSSHWEGFGLAALEGMACGKPVIASDVPGLREVVQGAGILFASGDSRGLATIVLDLLSDDRRVLIGEKCKSRSAEYDIEKMVDEYLALYARVVAESLRRYQGIQ